MKREDLRNGDIVVTTIGGIVPGLFPVAVGQALLFATRAWWRYVRTPARWWRWRHIAIVVDGGTGLCQAMPGGVEIIPFPQHLLDDPHTLFIRPDYGSLVRAAHVPGENVADFVAQAAAFYEGTPYGFLTYVKLAAGAFRMRLTERWLRRLISTRRDMICSQHVDQALTDAGYHVFDDGRLPQDVVPAELALALLDKPGWYARGGEGPGWAWSHERPARRAGEQACQPLARHLEGE